MDIIDYRYIILYYNIIHVHIHITYIYIIQLYRLYITLPNKQGLRQVIAHLMQDEGHHHAAASAQVRAFGRLLKNEARGARQSGKGRRWPGKVRGKSMAKYGQILPIWGKIDPWSILVHEKLEKKLLVGVFSIYDDDKLLSASTRKWTPKNISKVKPEN